MIIIKGQTYNTIIDAAEALNVSAKTIRNYIKKNIIPEPPVVKYGLRSIFHFPADYMTLAEKNLEKYSENMANRNSKHNNSTNDN